MIKKQKIADAVIDEIKRMIENGELKEGDKLPNQSVFAEQLQVSRTSLREAIRVLDLLGAIEQRPGFGTVLKKVDPILLSSGIVVPPLMSDSHSTIELIKARQIIEVGATELAAQNADPRQIDELSSLADNLSSAKKNQQLDLYIENDLAFHILIAESSNNRFIIYSFENLKSYIKQYMKEFFREMPGMLKSSEKFHRNLYDCIAKRKPIEAKKAMNDHIENIHKNYLLYIEKIG